MPTGTPPSRAVAVLGATGCVGRQVCASFARQRYDVLQIARRPAPHLLDGHAFVPLDVAAASARELADVLESARVDVLVNATGGWHVTEEANEYAHVTLVERFLGATALMRRTPRVVQVGTIHEYGPVPAGVPIDESVTPRPETAYARTKLAGAQAILRETRAGRAHGVVLRAVNVCGPYTTSASFLGSVTAMLRDAVPGQELVVNIADAERDYIDARDLAEAVVRAASAPAVGQVVNIGRGEAVTMREAVALLVSVAGFPADAIREGSAAVSSKGGGWTQADIRLAGRLLGWHPRIGLRDSMRQMWRTASVTPCEPARSAGPASLRRGNP
ncbi:NAD-dependent epimerase/dehydratase family protein [Streptomyces sp. NPDC020801]|uniref:NAD-dependent epimerase/dehydratase family protein n=1 Tax=unclassified Streptomyces TaxID=2593676 RepID=UPI0037A03820